jgi:CBS domain containing-hemolysin-like protein
LVLIAEGRGSSRDFAHRLLTGAIVFSVATPEVMVPRPDTVAVSSEATVAEIEDVVVRSGHSRIPVHTGDLDDVVGFVHVKDLLGVDGEARDRPPDPSLVRPLLVVPETVPVSTLLTRMRRAHSQMALVIDEHGGASGIITLEDIAEELVGDIWDEYDRQPTLVRTLADGSLVRRQCAPSGWRWASAAVGQVQRCGFVIPPRARPRMGDVVEEGD